MHYAMPRKIRARREENCVLSFCGLPVTRKPVPLFFIFFTFFFFFLSLQRRNWNRPWSLVILNIQHLSLNAPSRRLQGTLLVKTAPSKPPASFLLSVELPMCPRAHYHSERWKHGGPLVWGGVSTGLEETSLGFVRSFRTWERFKMLENAS